MSIYPLLFFNKYKEGIKNSFRFPYSNGITEGLNNKLKVIKRIAYGYRNFYHFRSRIYIIQGLIFSQQ
ncbi:TPA: transposase [Enterococcus faecalis]|nr:transposase [Enterococcus faecalis]